MLPTNEPVAQRASRQACGGAGQRDEQALGEQQPDEPRTGPIPSAARIAISRWRTVAAHQQQVRDVHARDEQHESRESEHRRPRTAASAATMNRIGSGRASVFGNHARPDPLFLRIRSPRSRSATTSTAACAAATLHTGSQPRRDAQYAFRPVGEPIALHLLARAGEPERDVILRRARP